jgi:cytochrome c-type biogenesis protein CcmH
VDVYQFPDAQVEARYRVLIDEFRCPKCLNTNLAGSDAPIARDLRRTVHRLLVVDGLRDDEVRDFLQERYGDFVLYNPPFKPGTWILWLSPLAFVALGAIILLRVLRKQQSQVALSDDEVARLRSIVDDSAAQGRPVTQDPG